MPIINKSFNGQLIYCKKCGLYHLEFGNLNFDFSAAELDKFRSYIYSIDGEFLANKYRHTSNRRKIQLPTRLKGFHFCLSFDELNDLKNILSEHPVKSDSLYSNIQFGFSMN